VFFVITQIMYDMVDKLCFFITSHLFFRILNVYLLNCYPPSMESGGGIVLALSLRPSVRPSVCLNFVSGLVLCYYWLEFNETSWEPLIPIGDTHIVSLFRSDTLTQSFGPWLVMHNAYRVKVVSALLLCYYGLEFNDTLWEPSIPIGDAHIVSLFRSDTLN
jgi:hypothetical protein